MKQFQLQYSELTTIVNQLRKLVKEKVPNAIVSEMNIDKRETLINSVWDHRNKNRYLSPLRKGFKPSLDEDPLVTSPYTRQERSYIKQVIYNLSRKYGSPIFQYAKDMSVEDYLRVKQWQAITRISPKITAGMTGLRYDKLKGYIEVEKRWLPDPTILGKAVRCYLDQVGDVFTTVKHKPEVSDGLFKAHDSNVGMPYYTRETKELNGVKVKDMTLNLTKRLNASEPDALWMTACQATIIGRDQSGGMMLDMSRSWTTTSLISFMDEVKYKPAKARVVWMVPRVVNNNISPVVNALINNDKFKNNPVFCAFIDREERKLAYHKMAKFSKKYNLRWVNVDFETLDITVAAEFLYIVNEILFHWVDVLQAPNKLKEATFLCTAYTKFEYKKPYGNRIMVDRKEQSIPSGIGTTNLYGSMVVSIAMIYCLIKLRGEGFVQDLINKAKSMKTSLFTAAGDDLEFALDDIDQLRLIKDIMYKDFGLKLDIASEKMALGIDFLQEFYINGKIVYPTARSMGSAMYTERNRTYGPYQWVMVWLSQLWNLRENEDKVSAAATLCRLDKMRLGYRHIDGSQNTLSSFRNHLKTEMAQYNVVERDIVWNGDPSKQGMFDDKGHLNSKFFEWAWDLIKEANSSLGQVDLLEV